MDSVETPLRERSWEALEWPKVKEKLAELATSSLGKELCDRLSFWEDESTVSRKLQETTELKRALEKEDPVPMGGIHDLRRILERSRKGSILEPSELLTVSETLMAGSRLKAYFYQRRELYPLLFRLAQPLADLRGLERTISSCFDDGGEVSDEASPVLRHLRREARLLHQHIKDRLTSFLNSPVYVHFLQEHYYTLRENRYVILVKAEARSKVPGIVHDTSLSGATVFIEPQELVELNNQLKMAELEVEREIYRILRELSSLVVDHILEISSNLEVLGDLDLTYSKARLSQRLEACAPHLSSRSQVDLLSARHPLMVLSQKEVVPNGIRLGQEGQALIVTGPNAGGKTIALKTLGLCALMVKAGLHIPASPGSEMPLFSEVYADIGDQQSIESDLSTFSAHLLQILEILRCAGPSTLVLLDEIATATDPDEGAALAQAILERLVGQGALTMATTHYGRLKALASQNPLFVNAGLEFYRADLRPTYRLILGNPGRSFGMEIARRLGLPAEVYERAKELLGGEQEGLNCLLEDLERRRLELADEQKVLARDREEAAGLRQEYETRLAKLREEKEKILSRSLQEMTTLLTEGRRQVDVVLEEIKAERRLEKAREAKKVLVRLEDEVREGIRKARKELAPSLAPSEEEFAPCRQGETVQVIPLGQMGVLLDDPAQTGKVRVQVGSIQVTVGADELRPYRGASRRTKEQGRGESGAWGGAGAEKQRGRGVEERTIRGEGGRSSRGTSPPGIPASLSPDLREEKPKASLQMPTSENSCDLRGLRIDEALDKAERFLDRAMLSQYPCIYLIHGHGTGALKRSMRRYLEESPYVRRFRPGQPEEGGDGVTLVELQG